jgi:redox-sensitive bicupin YhaK (pirin superfamily)
VRLAAGQKLELDLRDGFSAALYVVQGSILVNGEKVGETELAVLDHDGDEVRLEAASEAIVFVMNGAPIDEPVVGYGPFVMNTTREIQQAYADFHAGRLGTIPTKEKTA